MRLFSFILFLFIVVAPIRLRAQTNTLDDNWRWIRFNSESGLPSNRVFDIVETSGGTPWANTQLGLAWYNGFFWTGIDSLKGLIPRMASFMVTDESDSLLVLMEEQLYYGGTHGFRHIPFIINNQERRVGSVAYFGNNSFLLVSDSYLYLLLKNVIQPFRIPNELKEQKILYVYNTGGHGVWLNTSNGIYHLEGTTWSLKLKANKTAFSVRFISENIHGDGFIFIGAPPPEAGLWHWSRSKPVTHDLKEGIENILGFDVGPNNEAFMVKESDEIKIYRGDGWEPIFSSPLQLKNVLFLKYRSNGDIWVGTESGLYLHTTSSKRWSTWKFPSPDQRNNINEIILTKDRSIWCATGDGLVIHKSDGTTQSIRSALGNNLGPLTGLVEDTEGNIWISSGHYFDGTYRWNGHNWQYFGLTQGLDAGAIHKIRMDKEGRLWFLGLYRRDFDMRKVNREPGVYVYANGRFLNWGKQQSFSDKRVYDFAHGSDDALWFGTSTGLYRWKPNTQDSPSTGIWKHWSTDNGLRSNRTFTLAIDKNDKLWFGDQWFGLGYLENDTPQYFTTADGLVSDAVWRIKFDGQGKLWIASRGGLTIYDHGTWSNFNINEGLNNSRIWPILPTGDQIYLGTSGGGVEILNLHEFTQSIPRLVMNPAIVEGRTVHLQWKTFAFWGAQAQEDIETRYRVDDGGWSSWNKERQIVLGDVTSGDHRFHLQVKNILGNFDVAGQIIPFTVPSPLHLQAIFIIPIGILFVSLVGLGLFVFSRKRINDAMLRKSELRYRNLFEMANDAIVIFEPENEIIFEVNKKATELYGFSKEEFIGKSLKSISKDVALGESLIQEILEAKQSKVFETEHVTSSGKTITLMINASLIEYDGRKAILSLNRDITDQKRSEEKLHESAQQQALVLSSLPMVFYSSSASPGMNTTWISEQVEHLTGYTPDQFLKDSMFWEPRLHPEDRERVLKEQQTVFQANHALVDYRWLCSDHTYRWFSDETVLVRDVEGNPKEIIGMWLDITERKQSESEIRLLAQTVASAKDCFSITDLDGKILFVNDAFAEEHGYTADELFGSNISIIHSRANPLQIIDQTRLATVESNGWYGEIQHQRKDGTEFPVELWSSVVHNEYDEPVAIVGVSRNITERKQYEADREKLIQELKDALAEVKTLSGLLPICSSCKKIRDDKGYWTQVETYVAKHSDAIFTHGICPDCTKELFPEIYDRIKDKNKSSHY